MKESFVLAWTTSSSNEVEPCWLMVRDSQRGWELPGGKINDGEAVSYTHLTLPTILLV